jgi:chlorite dismutase
MRSSISTLVRLAVLVCVVLAIVPTVEAADRDKLLSEPGVYGTFAAFSLDADWGKQDQAVRIAQLTVLKGWSSSIERSWRSIPIFFADCPIRRTCSFVYTRPELRETQQFLLDLQGSSFGKHLKTAVSCMV